MTWKDPTKKAMKSQANSRPACYINLIGPVAADKIFTEEGLPEDTALHVQLQQAMEEDDSSEERDWGVFTERNQRRGRLQTIQKVAEDEDEDEDEIYTLKDTDMLWEIGCKVCHLNLLITFLSLMIYRLTASTM